MQYYDPPVRLLADEPDPQPVAGCEECTGLDKRLKSATDPSARTDIRIILRKHLKEHAS